MSLSRECWLRARVQHYIRLGQALKARREALGLTQTEIASRLGMTRSNVSQLEAGRIRTPLDVLEAYAEMVGARFECAIEAAEDYPSAAERIADLWVKLSANERELLLSMLEVLERQHLKKMEEAG